MQKTKNREDSLRKKLIKRAMNLAAAGFSPIPVHGNSAPAEPKRPAISWRVFQGRIASAAEIQRSFSEKVTALGIVCGRVSRLLVIDFDDVLRYQRFCRHLPQYADTYTVKTKRGFHLYFRTSEKVPSHQFDGGDIKGERSYIIAPPSMIGSFTYRCISDVGERELSRDDVDQLLNYFHINSSSHVVAGRLIRESKEVDLHRVYRKLAPRMGRNNALYRVACMAREAGVAKADAAKELIKLHVEAPGRPGHKYETARERWQEGLRTVESAYGGKGKGEQGHSGLPNAVRERLLSAQRSTVLARLLDILYLAGWEVDSYFTLREAIDLARRYGLNRKSVLQALTGDHCTYDARHIISRRYVEYLDSGGLKSGKRGRPVELAFQVPSVARLLAVFKLGRSPSDPMSAEDVRSAKSYRMALHREYIRRLSPRSTLAVLARRVGVNERTIRRYNRALDVKLTACVGRLRLTRETLASLPKRGWRTRKNTTEGFWLETAEGSRLPAWRHLGAKLLNGSEGGAHICAWQASMYSVKAEARAAVQFENMSLRQFSRLLLMRGAASGEGGLLSRLGQAVDAARERADAMRYEKVQLTFDNVDQRIADDKVAETISGYLVAYDESGAELRRPARRGIAYRMLKEHGKGNVYLALRSAYKDVMMSLARHALRAGDVDQGLELATRSLA